MPVIIKNSGDLQKLLKETATAAMSETQKEIYETIKDSIEEYYHEYNPSTYERTFRFLQSLVFTSISISGNTIECEVRLDEKFLKSSYPNQLNSIHATGQDVAEWANRDIPGMGNHGGTIDAGRGEGFWDIGLRDLGFEIGIITILKNNLKKHGLTIV